MPEIRIDENLCKRCGTCTFTCPQVIFQQEERGAVPELARVESCMHCGQCVAVCPQGAISHSDYPEGTVQPVRPDYLPSYDHVLELVRSRRSRRHFREKDVEREVIEKVLDAARFAPSEHNAQGTEFVVIQDRDIIHEIGVLTVRYYDTLVKRLGTPVGRAMFRLVAGKRGVETVLELAPEIAGLVSLFNRGTDLILREAPVLLFACADTAGGFPAISASLALQNAALAAETLGLACFYPGFVVRAGMRDDSIARFISLPETHGIYGGLAMGYPRVRFRKWPERNPARVTWLGEDGGTG
jgi:nitroreductase/NAD-dependent dihydropyrimidine dehydrogenase PreA subunit